MIAYLQSNSVFLLHVGARWLHGQHVKLTVSYKHFCSPEIIVNPVSNCVSHLPDLCTKLCAVLVPQ